MTGTHKRGSDDPERRVCALCRTRDSCLWRHCGPTGSEWMCNRCGCRQRRQRIKQRRLHDRAQMPDAPSGPHLIVLAAPPAAALMPQLLLQSLAAADAPCWQAAGPEPAPVAAVPAAPCLAGWGAQLSESLSAMASTADVARWNTQLSGSLSVGTGLAGWGAQQSYIVVPVAPRLAERAAQPPQHLVGGVPARAPRLQSAQGAPAPPTPTPQAGTEPGLSSCSGSAAAAEPMLGRCDSVPQDPTAWARLLLQSGPAPDMARPVVSVPPAGCATDAHAGSNDDEELWNALAEVLSETLA
eukprot:scaffold12.g8041.t1